MAGVGGWDYMATARKIRHAARELDATYPSGLRLIGEEIMTDVEVSRPGRGVPRDTGNLASTRRVEGGGRVGPFSEAKVTLSFGGAAAPYALVQHENMQYNHKLGEARYLVRGVERWQPDGSVAVEAMKANAKAALQRVARS